MRRGRAFADGSCRPDPAAPLSDAQALAGVRAAALTYSSTAFGLGPPIFPRTRGPLRGCLSARLRETRCGAFIGRPARISDVVRIRALGEAEPSLARMRHFLR